MLFSDAMADLFFVQVYIMQEMSVGPPVYGLLFAASTICAVAILLILFPVLERGSDDLKLLRTLNHMSLFIKIAIVPFFFLILAITLCIAAICLVVFIFMFLIPVVIAFGIAYACLIAFLGSLYSFVVIRSRTESFSDKKRALLIVLQVVPVLDLIGIFFVHYMLRKALKESAIQSDEIVLIENSTPPD